MRGVELISEDLFDERAIPVQHMPEHATAKFGLRRMEGARISAWAGARSAAWSGGRPQCGRSARRKALHLYETDGVTTEDTPPKGYREPITAWCVEYVDPREPEVGSHQVGAFTTEAEAEKLKRRFEAEGYFAALSINLVPVHRKVEDWEWDR